MLARASLSSFGDKAVHPITLFCLSRDQIITAPFYISFEESSQNGQSSARAAGSFQLAVSSSNAKRRPFMSNVVFVTQRPPEKYFPERYPAVPAIDRVLALEAAFAQSIGDHRFLPHILLHEYEALLYCDLNAVKIRIEGSERGLEGLRDEVRHLNPEDINEGRETAPNKRLIQAVPAYEKLKVRVGGPAGVSIGLPAFRQGCPHFDSWVDRMEALRVLISSGN